MDSRLQHYPFAGFCGIGDSQCCPQCVGCIAGGNSGFFLTADDGASLLANSIALGMGGRPSLEIDINSMAADGIVADIVYVPLKTPLLAAADACGMSTANGLDMLLHQAVTGFELWFGTRSEVTREQYELLAADTA